MLLAVNVGSIGCLQAVGPECGLIGADCEPVPQRVGAECEPKMTLVCRSGCRCLQAVTISHNEGLVRFSPTQEGWSMLDRPTPPVCHI